VGSAVNTDRSTRAVSAPQAIGPADQGCSVCRLYVQSGESITYQISPNGNAAGIALAPVTVAGPAVLDEDLSGGVTLNVSAIVGAPVYRMLPHLY
jgi:hypothetical protein